MVTELLFGKRQANIGSAILQNYERAQQIYEDSLTSDGSALGENEKYLESVEGHLKKLQASWEAFSVSLADSTAMKGIIDLGNGVVKILDAMTTAFGSLGMVAIPFMASLSKLGNIGREYALLCGGNTTHRMLAA